MATNQRTGFLRRLCTVVFIFLVTAGPANQMPEQISGAQPEWDTNNQRFLVRVTVRYGVAEAGVNDSFDIWTQLQLFDLEGNYLNTIQNLSPVSIGTDDPTRDRNAVPLSPLPVPWDRNGGSYSGDVFVIGTSALVNELDRIIFVTEYESLVSNVGGQEA